MRSVITVTSALADETRIRILMALEGSTLCLCHLTEILGLAPSTISKHLKILTDAGLISVTQEGKWRYFRLAETAEATDGTHPMQWVTRHMQDDPVVREDRARRAVALESQAVPFPTAHKPTVLFLCTGNACRSQIAEALLRDYAGNRFQVLSAGLEPRDLPALTRSVMEEWDISLDQHRSKHVSEFIGRVAIRYLIVVCRKAESRVPVFPGVTERLYWPIESPSGRSKRPTKTTYRHARDQVDGRILDWLDELSTRGFITRLKRPRPPSARSKRNTQQRR